MDTKEAKNYLVEICQTVITTLAEKHQIDKHRLNIRIDMENIGAKPVFALFHKSQFIAPCSLKEIIHAGGGKGFTMLLSMHIKGIITDIFEASLQRFELTSTKDLFILLYLKADEPVLGIFVKGEFQEFIPIGEIIGEGI